MCIEKDITSKTDFAEIIQEFVKKKIQEKMFYVNLKIDVK